MEKIAKNIAWIIATILLSIVFLSNLFFTAKIDIYEIVTVNYSSFLSMLICLVIVALISFISNKIEKKCSTKIKIILLILVLAACFIFQILWINVRKAKPCWDQWYVYDMAAHFSDIDYRYAYKDYYEKCPHQLGIVTFYVIIFKIFNTTDVSVLQYINALANVFTILGIILISKIIEKKYKTNKTKTLIASLLFTAVPLLSTFIYGDILAISFCTFATYFIMQYGNTRKTDYAIYSALCMLVACLVRKNSLIFLIAILIYVILCLLEEKKFNIKNAVKTAGIIVIFLVMFSGPNKLIKNYWQQKLNLNFENELPAEIYLSYGINESERAPGWYNSGIHMKAKELESSAKVYGQKLVKRRLKIFLKNPLDFFDFYIRKERAMWTENTYASFLYNNSANIWDFSYQNGTQHQKVDKVLEKVENVAIILNKTVIILAFGNAIITLIRYRGKISKDVLLLAIIFTGGFIFQMMWEAKSRYIIPYIIILFPFIGIDNTECIKEKIYKIKGRNSIK